MPPLFFFQGSFAPSPTEKLFVGHTGHTSLVTLVGHTLRQRLSSLKGVFISLCYSFTHKYLLVATTITILLTSTISSSKSSQRP